MNAETFKSIFDQLVATRDRQYNKAKIFNASLINKKAKIIKSICPKKKNPKPKDYETHPNYVAWVVYFVRIAKAYWDNWGAKVDKLENQLKECAKTVNIANLCVEDIELRVYSCSTSTYSTQTDSHGYAHNNVKRREQKAQFYGLKTEIRDSNHYTWGGNYPGSGCDYDLWVNLPVEDWVVKLFDCLPLIPLKEEVRRYWKCGKQPRVDMWWLPHEYEEQIGIDYFGNVVDQEKWTKA